MLKNNRIGLARMHAEKGERRDFLPAFAGWLESNHFDVYLEHEYGSGMGFTESDYLKQAPHARFVHLQEIFKQDFVLVLRCPDDHFLQMMQSGSCLISMLHYPTRPKRVAYLRQLGIEAISLDEIKDDSKRRLVENLTSVAWNGVEVAFRVLKDVYPSPGLMHPARSPLQVLLLGPGAVGTKAVQAAVHYGDRKLRQRMVAQKVPGVQVNVIDYDLTSYPQYMIDLLSRTDLLIDATQRPDASKPVIPNEWIAVMPAHAVLLDLSVDPYNFEVDPPVVKGIEGVPQGNLDQYIFTPNDPAWDRLPEKVITKNRRHAVSCYSWPGIHPEDCMKVYGTQLRPLIRTIAEAGKISNINPNGNYFHRALSRAMLSRWYEENGGGNSH
jgi:alanine dehydrogenase